MILSEVDITTKCQDSQACLTICQTSLRICQAIRFNANVKRKVGVSLFGQLYEAMQGDLYNFSHEVPYLHSLSNFVHEDEV